METPTAIVLSVVSTAGIAAFGAIGWMLRRIDSKLDRVADRLTKHEIECARRWAEKRGARGTEQEQGS